MRPGKLSTGVLAAIAVGAIAVFLSVGEAVREVRVARKDEGAFRAASQAYEAQKQEAQRVEKETQAAAQALAKMEAAVSQALPNKGPGAAALAGGPGAKTSAAPRANPQATARADGQDFLTTVPQARDMTSAVGRAQIAATLGPFFKSAGIPDAQAQQFADLTLQTWLQSTAINPEGMIRPTQVFPSADDAKAVLGDQGYQQFQDYVRTLAAQSITSEVQMAAAYASEPLSADQSARMTQILEANSASYQGGKGVDLKSINWSAALSQAQNILSPQQMTALNTAAVRFQYYSALQQAQVAATK